jgi:hypothetical protein
MAVSACSPLAFSSLANASDWGRYGNARFNYLIDIPPSFSKVQESDSGDGGVSSSANGGAELSVWGSDLGERSFADEIRWRADQDRSEGWTISYQKQFARSAVWSGRKGNRVFYARGIPVCDGAAAYFRLEYNQQQTTVFDSVISRLGKSLRSGKC